MSVPAGGFNALFIRFPRISFSVYCLVIIMLFCSLPACSRNKGSTANENESKTSSEIVITSPSAGPVSGLITIQAELSDQNLGLKCTFNDSDLADVDDRSYLFSSVIDTTFYPDGEATISCLSDGPDPLVKKANVVISNQNPVSFSVFVAEQVTDLNSVVVFSETGKLVTVLKPSNDGKISAKLPAGLFIFEVSGGNYISRALTLADKSGNPRILTLSTKLTGRALIKAGAQTEVIITPITSFIEKLAKSLKKKNFTDPVEESRRLVSNHFGADFDYLIKPSLENPMSAAWKHYLVLTAIEQLGMEFSAMNSMTPGSITSEDVTMMMEKDIEDGLLDGNGGNLNFYGVDLDSYFLRYWLAVSLKNIAKNMGISFSDVQDLIYNISMDTSSLFPISDIPRELVDQPPKIIDVKFKTSSNEAFIGYDKAGNSIPFSGENDFMVSFRIKPAKDQRIPESGVIMESGSANCSITKPASVNEDGIYKAICRFDPMVPDGLKEIMIEATDEAGNKSCFILESVKDSTPPKIDVLDCPEAPVKSNSEHLNISMVQSETNPESTACKVNSSMNFSCKAGETISLGGNNNLREGENIFFVTSRDMAGNMGIGSCKIVIDETPPSMNSGAMTRYNPSILVNHSTNDLKLRLAIERMKLSDNLSDSKKIKAFYSLERDGSSIYKGPLPLIPDNIDYYTLDWNLDKNHKYNYTITLFDEAGNSSIIDQQAWYIDHTPPPITYIGPETIFSPRFEASVMLGSGSEDPDGKLFPDIEMLDRVDWQDLNYGTHGTCEKKDQNAFKCIVDSGKNPPPGIHEIIFTSFDSQGNHEEDISKCGRYNKHCLKIPVTFNTTAPKISGFVVSPEKSRGDIVVAWDLENSETTYTCLIGRLDGTSGELLVDYNCSGDRNRITNLLAKDFRDGYYIVRLTADRNGLTAQEDKGFLLDGTKPILADPILVGQDESTFTIDYRISETSLVSIDSSLGFRKYYEPGIGVVSNSEEIIPLGRNPVTNNSQTLTYSKQSLPGGVYNHVSIEACDDSGNCQASMPQRLIADGMSVFKETRPVRHSICTESDCFSNSRTIDSTVIRPKAINILPCDTCVENIIPSWTNFFIEFPCCKHNINSFNVYWTVIPLRDSMMNGAFTFPYQFNAVYKFNENGNAATKTIRFTKTDVLPPVVSCRNISPAKHVCEFMMNNITQDTLNTVGCIYGIRATGSLETASAEYCPSRSSMVNQLAIHPGTFAVKYCSISDSSLCVFALGESVNPIWVEFWVSGKLYKNIIFEP